MYSGLITVCEKKFVRIFRMNNLLLQCLCYSRLHTEPVLTQQEATLLRDEKHILQNKITPENLAVLRRHFAENQRPCENSLKELAITLHLPIRRVKSWFVHKRFRSKRKELTNESLGETIQPPTHMKALTSLYTMLRIKNLDKGTKLRIDGPIKVTKTR